MLEMCSHQVCNAINPSFFFFALKLQFRILHMKFSNLKFKSGLLSFTANNLAG